MIYLDHAATTAVDKRVLQKMLPYFCEHYGNPGSGHRMGHEAATAVYSLQVLLAVMQMRFFLQVGVQKVTRGLLKVWLIVLRVREGIS